MHIFLIYGGKSAEHRVSVNSAASFLNNVSFDRHTVTPVYITKDGEWLRGSHWTEVEPFEEEQLMLDPEDSTALRETEKPFTGRKMAWEELKEDNSVVFPLLHGPNGEDGKVQGMLDLLNVPYAGPGMVPSVCGMDKIISKDLFAKAGIPQTDYFAVMEKEWLNEKEAVLEKCETTLSYPIYIKPANLGSSIGITEAKSPEELEAGFAEAFRYDRRVVVEQGLEDARELNVAIIGNGELKTSIVGELKKRKGSGFYNYEDKYINRTAQQQYPAEVTEEQRKLLQEYSLKGFQAIDGNGMCRVDLFLTDDGKVYLNEINTIPGFAAKSIFAQLWEHSGVPFTELIDQLVQFGLKRHETKREKEQQTETVEEQAETV